MKILVTGAGGFLGQYVVKKLLAEGHTVTNFSRSSYSLLEEIGVKTIKGDLSSFISVKTALTGQEAVFHIASKVGMWGDWDDYHATNVIGTENVILACQKLNIEFIVYTSTPSVAFGKGDLMGVDELTPIPETHLNFYAKSKAMAEAKILAANNNKNLYTVSLRPHLIFGPGDQNLIPTVISKAKSGKLKIVGDGNNLVDVIYVENAAQAHIDAFNKLRQKKDVCGKAYFLGQDRPVCLWDFINDILKMKKIDPLTKKISIRSAYLLGSLFEKIFKVLRIKEIDPPMTRFVALSLGKSHYFSHENAKNDFGFSPVISTQDAIVKTCKSIV